MLSAASFGSTLTPNTPPFVPITIDGISIVANSGNIAVASAIVCYLSFVPFFSFVDGEKQNTLHLIFYCMPPGQTKPQ